MKSLTYLPVLLLLLSVRSYADDLRSLWQHLSSAPGAEQCRGMTASFNDSATERTLILNVTASQKTSQIAWLDLPAPTGGWNLERTRYVETTLTNVGTQKVDVMLWVVAHLGWTAVGEEASIQPGDTAVVRCDLRKTYRDGSPIIDPSKIRHIRIMTRNASGASLKVTGLMATGQADEWIRPQGRLDVPDMTVGVPGPGKRVRYQLPADIDNNVYSALYLPSDWQPGKRYPVIAELPGNIYYNTESWSTGRPEQCVIGYGISKGEQAIWVSLPFVDRKKSQIAEHGFGSNNGVDTVAYVQAMTADICENWGGDPDNLILSGFSRGAIACGYIGLANDEIAQRWKGFVACQHYDGSAWQQSNMADAITRAPRFRGRAIFQIDNESHSANFQQLMEHTDPSVKWTWASSGLGDHATAMFLDERPMMIELREWFHNLTAD